MPLAGYMMQASHLGPVSIVSLRYLIGEMLGHMGMRQGFLAPLLLLEGLGLGAEQNFASWTRALI